MRKWMAVVFFCLLIAGILVSSNAVTLDMIHLKRNGETTGFYLLLDMCATIIFSGLGSMAMIDMDIFAHIKTEKRRLENMISLIGVNFFLSGASVFAVICWFALDKTLIAIIQLILTTGVGPMLGITERLWNKHNNG